MRKIGTFMLMLVLASCIVYSWWSNRPIVHPPGVIAAAVPVQAQVELAEPIRLQQYSLHPQASFTVEGRILSRKHYWLGREAELVPVDLAVGWGRMSDQVIIQQIQFSQSNRFCRWYVKRFPIPRQEIESCSSNMHLIPANKTITRQIKRTRVGQVVRFSGYLVNVHAEDGWYWKTSLSRNDTGNGACELVYVTAFSHLLP